MLKKLIAVVATMLATMSFAFAQVDVNKADQTALDGIKGIGPAMSKRILEERSKNGAFKDWSDLETRVKGIGEKNAVKFSEAGLTVSGQTKTKTAVAAKSKSVKPIADTSGDKDAKPKKEKKSTKDKDAAATASGDKAK